MTARGIRNKNVGNIRLGDKWQGMSEQQTDPDFVQFTDMVYGVRALIKLLMNYNKKYNLDTVKDIITRWAPSNENNTTAYINAVAKELNVEPEEKLNLSSNTELYIPLAKAIVHHECGKDASLVDEALYQQALDMLI